MEKVQLFFFGTKRSSLAPKIFRTFNCDVEAKRVLYQQGTLPERCFIAVPPLDSDDVSAILESWLHASRRALQPRQMELLRDACARCRIPLFTKIAFDETRRWRSYTDVTSLQIGDSVPVLINTLLDRVEVYHGKVLVAQALAVLTAAKSGIR